VNKLTRYQTLSCKRERADSSPAFEVRDIDGEIRNLSDYKGKYLVMDFWFTSCGPCIEDTPTLKAWHESLDPEKVVLLGVSVDSRRQDVQDYRRKTGITWPQVFDQVDNTGILSDAYNVEGFPCYYVINPEGQLTTITHSLEEVVSRLSNAL
jgi:cytochrome oxidase Cu insertion factor (SCO1/SenC/PrrC family)